jgi:hypothetical protein
MSLAELRKQALATRAKILKELEEEIASEERRFEASVKAARNAEQAARNAERAARNAIRSARASMKAIRSVKTRKRAAGANYEVAGKPAHLAPGVPLRRVEGTRHHSQTLALTRGKRSKAKY